MTFDVYALLLFFSFFSFILQTEMSMVLVHHGLTLYFLYLGVGIKIVIILNMRDHVGDRSKRSVRSKSTQMTR